ncbi:hypothetical protein R1sor_006295 [Riccia sorocarpa]|uniref:Uncharacterized protein n=1 Tax=Riccia sorocarpa TaxID=122646 RepID=A0ABD3HTH1_9MARC
MTVGLMKDGYAQLTAACRKFLWGRNAEGTNKKALVAWKKICRKKEGGGLGVVCFELQAQTLKMWLVSKLLEDTDLDWDYIAKTIIIWKILDTKTRVDEIGRPVQELLILGNQMRLGEAPNKILEGWWMVKKYLKFKEDLLIPRDLRLDQALRLVAEEYHLKEAEIRHLFYEVFQRSKGCLLTTRIIQEALELAIEIEKSGSQKEAAEAVTYLTSLGMVENQNRLRLQTLGHRHLAIGNLLEPISSRSSKSSTWLVSEEQDATSDPSHLESSAIESRERPCSEAQRQTLLSLARLEDELAELGFIS